MLLWAVLLLGLGVGGGVSAQITEKPAPDLPVVVREVRQGETLIAIAREMLDTGRDWRALAQFNQLKRPDRLAPGWRLRIPAPWIKPLPVEASISALSGTLRLAGRDLKVGDVVPEGTLLETGQDTVVVLSLPDGSRLRLAPASAVRLERLRRYHEETVVDALIRLERGRIEAFAQPGRTRPLQIRAPSATAAVRGTEFRVGALEDNLSTAEVLTGGVAWGSASREARVAGGFGSTADQQGRVSEPVALLPAPDLRGLPPSVETVGIQAVFPAVPGASAYRLEVASDERFEKPILQTLSLQPTIEFSSLDDGPHYLRLRAVAPSRLEGFDARAMVMFRARPFAPPVQQPADGQILFETAALLEWQPHAGVSTYRVQLSASPDFSTIESDRQVIGQRLEVAAAQGGGSRYWRVSSVDGTGRNGPFGQVRRIEWRLIPPAPRLELAGEQASLVWAVPPGHRSVIELRWQPRGEAERVREIELDPPAAGGTGRLLVEGPPPGAVAARLRLLAPDKVATPFSPTVRWVRPDPVRSNDGSPLQTGSGGLVGSPGP